MDGLRLLFSAHLDFAIVGTANDGKTTLKDIKSIKPDIALIDLRMPQMDGLELIKTLSGKVKTKFIILSMYNQPKYIKAAIDMGASAYLLKNTGQEEMLQCIYSVINGGTQFPNIPAEKSGEQSVYLSIRELSILKFIINEYTNQDIAKELNLSVFTIETHRKNIFKKTNSKSPVGLMKYAIENGIVSDDSNHE
jgi:DNA-binding NarL/FixJ family response regulator